jgi:DNA-binding HxlR family transcriptional regulator
MNTNIADAFDLVGKRWALQVVRELALGPQRYTDLRRRLAGISTNVLASRLLELQQAEVARRRLLPPPAGSAVYELTERGRELGLIVLALDGWGRRTLQQPHESRSELARANGSRAVSAPDSPPIDGEPSPASRTSSSWSPR